jgi:hypothetical protein
MVSRAQLGVIVAQAAHIENSKHSLNLTEIMNVGLIY